MSVILQDYHVHSFYCRHGEGQIHEYVEQAIARGCSEIGFAEHIPIPALDDDEGRMAVASFPAYLRDVRKAQSLYPDIRIRLGLEADYIPEQMDYISRFIHDHPFDFVIGSVHFIDGWDFTNPLYLDRFAQHGVDETWRAYYHLVAEAADTGLYDIIGHFDIPKKYGHRPVADLSTDVRRALQAMSRNNLALDVNTSGRRRVTGEIHPSRDILKQALALGIPAVLGSDAHTPVDVASYFKETMQQLYDIGFRELCGFDKRMRFSFPLEI